MKRIVVIFVMFSSLMLSSCMMKYYYNNEEFSSKNAAYSAQDSFISNIKRSLYDPLSEPLSEKKLVIGIPTRETFTKTVYFQGHPTAETRENLKEFISTSNEKDFLGMAELVKEKRIYRNCEIIRTNGGDLQPSENEDVLYLFIPSQKAVQWYIADKKYGKQTIAPDTGIEDSVEKMGSWLQSVQAFAIRE